MKRISACMPALAGMLLVAAAACMPARAQYIQRSMTTEIALTQQDPGKRKGSEFNDEVRQVTELIRTHRLDEAEAQAQALRRKIEAGFDPALPPRTFQTQAEYEAYTSGAAQPVEWVDWNYFSSLHALAFIRSEKRDPEGALALLRELETVAPLSANVLTEKGHAFNMQRRYTEALATYKAARELAGRHPSQKPSLPLALRGAGFALIELDRLDEAEAAFKESLVVDPGNALAQNELRYIDMLRRRRGDPFAPR